MAQRYNPPQQSRGGQIFDVVLLLILVFLALFLPLWMQIAVPSRVEKLPEGVTYQTATDAATGAETRTWTGLSWEALGQNPTMQAQWEKLGYTPETAAEIITQPFEYDIDEFGVIVTAVVILAYYIFVLWASKKEYREVIREKFE
jgi:predicted PurR-regulated permease PerM